MTKPERRVLNTKEVAAYLKVSRQSIYKLARRGKIPAFRIGSDWRFNIESIDQWRLGEDR
ncbi:MAG TPA: helix-turn-helix domain-containing protein [Steroidobacteraceae bacterium]